MVESLLVVLASLFVIEKETDSLVRKLKIIGGRINAIVLASSKNAGILDRKPSDFQIAGFGQLKITECAPQNRELLSVSFDSGIFADQRIGFVVIDEQANFGIEIDFTIQQIVQSRAARLCPGSDFGNEQCGKRAILVSNMPNLLLRCGRSLADCWACRARWASRGTHRSSSCSSL